MLKYILLIIAPYIIPECPIKQIHPIKIEGFDKLTWTTDSVACQGKRKTLYKVLISNKEKIVGHTKEEVENFLGKPNSIDKRVPFTYYFLTSGPQCLYVNKDGYDSLEVKKIMIEYKECKVENISIILP